MKALPKAYCSSAPCERARGISYRQMRGNLHGDSSRGPMLEGAPPSARGMKPRHLSSRFLVQFQANAQSRPRLPKAYCSSAPCERARGISYRQMRGNLHNDDQFQVKVFCLMLQQNKTSVP